MTNVNLYDEIIGLLKGIIASTERACNDMEVSSLGSPTSHMGFLT